MTLEQIVSRVPVSWGKLDDIDKIITNQVRVADRLPVKSSYSYFLLIGLACYNYGVMQGKRTERARRKGKAAIGAGTPIAAVDTMQKRQSVKCEYNTTTHDRKGANE